MKVVFFTGAGVSAESGISTFRDSNGLWENNRIEEVCNIDTWQQNKKNVFKFYSQRRKQLAEVEPNKIHLTIAKLQKEFGPENVIIITQNVDDLFERAGCKNVLHVHGFLTEIVCKNNKCEFFDIPFNVGYTSFNHKQKCTHCKEESLKPNIVFFGESAPNYFFMEKEFRNLTYKDMLIVIGTMGNVVNINKYALSTNAFNILNNLEESPYIDNLNFEETFYKPGTEAIEDIEKIIRRKFKVRNK